MKSFIIILVIVAFATCVWSQTELEENIKQDTLNIEQAIIDTLEEKIDPKLLLVEMENFLDEKREMENDLFLPHLIYNENFHLSSPFNLNMRITKNGFSEIPFATGNLQAIQNNRSIFKTIYKRGNIFYNSWEYSLPVALTETYMGLGDIDMNNISVSLMKGSIFGIPVFNMQLDYLGEKGIWQGYENEASQNFNLHISYDLDIVKIHFDNSIIDQTLPGEKDIFNYAYPTESVTNKENEYSITIENNIIDIGFKYKNNNYLMKDNFRKERDLKQFLAQKRFHSQYLELNLSYEFILENILLNSHSVSVTTNKKNSYHIFSVDQDANILGFKFGNTGYCKDVNNFQYDSELSKEIYPRFSICGEYSNLSTEFYQDNFSTDLQHQTKSRVAGGILINQSHIRTKILMGQKSIDDSKINYYEIQSFIDISIANKFELMCKNWVRNEKIGEDYFLGDYYFYPIMSYPEWQISNLLEIKYLLEYNNAIKLGLRHLYHSNYSYYLGSCDSPSTSDTQNFDAYLKIQLTDRFEISVDAVNLTNNKIMFTNYNHPGTHFNFNVHWIFVN